MEKKIIITTQGYIAPVGEDLIVRRVLPSHDIEHLNPFVFLDHIGPTEFKATSKKSDGTGAHPHRGFITFTYLFSGELEHKDSLGNHSIVGAGGGQFMIAGSGIVHDEKPSAAFTSQGGVLHGFQLWINLPAKDKNETPRYYPLHSSDVPEIKDGNSVIRVLIGNYEGHSSSLPLFHPLQVIHVIIPPGSEARFKTNEGWDSGILVAEGSVNVGAQTLNGPLFAVAERENDELVFRNTSDSTAHLMIYSAPPLVEPIASYGPFVMNTQQQIVTAIKEYQLGRYGEIK